MIEAKKPKSPPNCPPKFAPLRILSKSRNCQLARKRKKKKKRVSKNQLGGHSYIPVMLALTHCTPCQPRPHGSPPIGIHPASSGKFKAA